MHAAPAGALRRIVLTGYMGAGKSTLGRALAAHLGWAFLDTDDLIQHATGSSIPAFFTGHGEPAFRRAESVALARALAQNDAVIALGGGAPEILTNRLLIEQTPGTCVLLLAADFPALYDRCLLQSVEHGAITRPNLADPAAAALRYRQRQPFYRRLAHHTIETAALSPAQTLAAALDLLRPRLLADFPQSVPASASKQ